MPETVSLKLPLLVAEQAQKHVTHNEALRALDALVQLSVKDRDLATPPGSPAEGDRYIVAASPTGVWSGHASDIAVFQDGAWDFHDPLEGWRCFVEDENAFLIFDGSAWVDWGAALGALQNLALLGVGTTADATNPFSAKLNKALWTAKYAAEGGDGDLRYTMNKEAAADVLSLLLQRAFSGRAEIGLIGDDHLTIKVSPDGSIWTNALVIDNATGGVRFLANEATVASAATCDIGAAVALKVQITGTTPITSFGSVANSIKLIRFAGALTLTHNATSLVLPGGASITTAAGDTALCTSDASGNWRVRAYQKASGKSVVANTPAEVGAVNIAGDTMAGALAISTSASPLALTRVSNTPGAGAFVTMTHDSATPAAGDVNGGLTVIGRDSGASLAIYATNLVVADVVTAGAHSGRWAFNTRQAGADGARMNLGGGLYHGSATGGDKGNNTINFGAVYDDNTLLTCAGAAREFLESGAIDTDKWDALIPDRIIPEHRYLDPVLEEVTVDAESFEVRDDHVVRRVERKIEFRQKKKLLPLVDENGGVIDAGDGKSVTFEIPEVLEVVIPERREKRRNEAVHLLAKMVREEGFDPRDPVSYFARMRNDEAVPGLPTQAEWSHGKFSLGEWFGRVSVALECLALVSENIEGRVRALEGQ